MIDSLMSHVIAKNPEQPEFHQAVREVVESLEPFLEQNPRYAEAKILERIIEPERVLMFRVPWVDDKGEIHINRGYRVQMNSALGPYKGGLRFHPTVNLGILKFLAFEQVFKNSLTTLPMGGGKGGSDFNPRGRSDMEVMRFCHSFMSELFRHIDADTDVPAGDIGVGAREIGYLFGMYKKLRNHFTGVLTGKGANWGGSRLRTEATGYGLVYFTSHMLEAAGKDFKGKRVTVSGSGNVSQYAVEKLLHMGATPITMSDSNGTIVVKDGIDEKMLAWIKELKNKRRGRIKEAAAHFDGVEFLEGARPWGTACDIAMPCATQNELNEADAKTLISNGCFCVAEGANMPTEADAMHALLDAEILFAPGKAANAGGVATSGLEMSQNSMRLSWSREEVDQRLRGIMENIHTSCVKHGRDDSGYINYVDGANLAGFLKVADAMLDQGVV